MDSQSIAAPGLSAKTRSEFLTELRNTTTGKPLDLLVIGGGITGAGLALEAASRGLTTVLIEKRDFGSGTSSRSTKLIHGGLRYLEHYDFALVREGLLERAAIFEMAPHVAHPFPFIIPIYKSRSRNYDRPILVRAGLILYDLLAGRYGIRRHHRISRDEALARAPQLDSEGLQGAYVYYDGRTNDSRLVIDTIKTAHRYGARLVNYASVQSFFGAPQLDGALIRDEFTGELIRVHARSIINATGVWMNETRALAGPLPETDRQLRPSKGIHLTVPAERLKVESAWLIPALGEHRFYFVVPWEDRVNIGTTDTDFTGDKDSPGALASEISQILDAINTFFPSADLTMNDVISAWAGLRPLISSGNSQVSSTAVSRKEEIFEDSDGLISLAGGKLTTFRLMAERGVDTALRRLSISPKSKPSQGRRLRLAGSGAVPSQTERETLADTTGISKAVLEHLIEAYGSEYQSVLEILSESEEYRQQLARDLPVIAAEVVYAVRHEMALTVADVMTRRTRIAMLSGDQGAAIKIARIMAQELGWGDSLREKMLSDYLEEYSKEYKVRRD